MSERPGEQFREAVFLGIEDARQRRLRYHLERLTTVGLSPEDLTDLAALGSSALQGFVGDLEPQAGKITQRADSSSLAVANAQIVAENAAENVASPGTVTLCASLGAYAAFGDSSTGAQQAERAVAGAIAGAVAAATAAAVSANIASLGTIDYVRFDG